MRFIDGLCEGETIRNVYLCKGKRSAETRNGKPYDNLILQDKTGTLDGKVWDPNKAVEYIYDTFEVTTPLVSKEDLMKVNKWTVTTKQPSYVCPYGPAGCADPKYVTKK